MCPLQPNRELSKTMLEVMDMSYHNGIHTSVAAIRRVVKDGSMQGMTVPEALTAVADILEQTALDLAKKGSKNGNG